MLNLSDAASTERVLAEIAARIDTVYNRGGRRLTLFVANTLVAFIVARYLHTRFGTTWQERAVLLPIDNLKWAELIGITTIR